MDIRVIYKGVGEWPERVELPDTIAALEAAVGGPSEVHTFNTNAAVICKRGGTAAKAGRCNCHFLGRDWHGPLLIVGLEEKGFCSIPERSMPYIEAMAREK